MREPEDELRKLVEFRYEGTFDLMELEGAGGGSSLFQEAIDVSYEFNDLASNSYLKNLVLKATSTQLNNFGVNQRLCRFFEGIDAQLTEQGYL